MADIVIDRVTHIEFPNTTGINTDNLRIESGSLLLEEILCEGNIVFGEVNATRFEATVYNLTDVSGLKIKVYQTDNDGNNRRDLFEGYVDSCKQDRDGYYRKLVAYDAFYSIGNANVAGWWYTFWSDKTESTLRDLRISLCSWAGITCDDSVSLHNDNFMCKKTATLSSVSFNTMLFWICEIQCTIPHIDRSGTLRYMSLAPSITNDITDLYERGSSEFEGFRTAPVTKVELYDYDNALVASTYTGTPRQNENIYVLKDNSLLFALADNESAAAEFVSNYLQQIQQIQYTPCDINMIVSDLSLTVGSYITIGTHTSIILQNTLSGSLLIEQEIQASGNEYLQDSSKTPTAEFLTIEKKTERLQDEIITDDLLNYAHTNDDEYTVGNVTTPVISLSIDMPKTSNLVFLATINLESVSTETREVRETVTINGEECEIIRHEKVPVVVEAYFEWNKIVIMSNKPTETYSEDGKHLLNLLFFTIGGREAGSVSSFQVFLTVKHGKVFIGKNQINATIISKGSSAGHLPWDGTIRVDEAISPVSIGTFTPTIAQMTETINRTEQTPTTPPIATESIGLITPNFNVTQIVGINDSVTPTTT
jgi:hypothetical protein